jgi:hypothetical protein
MVSGGAMSVFVKFFKKYSDLSIPAGLTCFADIGKTLVFTQRWQKFLFMLSRIYLT